MESRSDNAVLWLLPWLLLVCLLAGIALGVEKVAQGHISIGTDPSALIATIAASVNRALLFGVALFFIFPAAYWLTRKFLKNSGRALGAFLLSNSTAGILAMAAMAFLQNLSSKAPLPFFCPDAQCLRVFAVRTLAALLDSNRWIFFVGVAILFVFQVAAALLIAMVFPKLKLAPRKNPGTTSRFSVPALCTVLLLIAVINIGAILSRPRPSADSPNVLIISMDSVSARDLDFSDPKTKDRFPNLSRMAAKGVRFENAFSNAPWTLPAHASLFTSRPAWDIGATTVKSRLPESAQTIFESFRKSGYRTFSIVNCLFLTKAYGFAQGVDEYAFFQSEDDFEKITDLAIKQARGSKAPWLGFVHYFTPHWPYSPPEDLAPKLKSIVSQKSDFYQYVAQARSLSPKEMEQIRSAHLEEVEKIDRQIGRLFDALEKSSTDKNTLLVIMSDHGEAFGEQGAFGHGYFLDSSVLRIPLIFYSVGNRMPVDVFNQAVDLLDIAPTILTFAGLPPEPQFAGRDLSPLFSGGSIPDKPIFSHTTLTEPQSWSVIKTPYKLTSAVHAKYRDLVYSRDPTLFDLVRDPLEQTNLFATSPEIVRMLSQSGQKIMVHGATTDSRVGLSPSDLDSLRSLGYLH